MSLLSNIFSMGTKKTTPLNVSVETPENVDTQEAGVESYIDLVRFYSKDLPLASQINTLLDEVERLARVK